MNSSEHAETCYGDQMGEATHADLNNSRMHAATVIYYTPYTMPAGRPAERRRKLRLTSEEGVVRQDATADLFSLGFFAWVEDTEQTSSDAYGWILCWSDGENFITTRINREPPRESPVSKYIRYKMLLFTKENFVS